MIFLSKLLRTGPAKDAWSSARVGVPTHGPIEVSEFPPYPAECRSRIHSLVQWVAGSGSQMK